MLDIVVLPMLTFFFFSLCACRGRLLVALVVLPSPVLFAHLSVPCPCLCWLASRVTDRIIVSCVYFWYYFWLLVLIIIDYRLSFSFFFSLLLSPLVSESERLYYSIPLLDFLVWDVAEPLVASCRVSLAVGDTDLCRTSRCPSLSGMTHPVRTGRTGVGR